MLHKNGKFQNYTWGKPAPVGLAIDQIGYAHLLLYDFAEHALWYVTADKHNFSKPLQLAENVPSNPLPAFLLDSVQNIHIAWVEEQKLHYRLRLAGGWPTGGWQRPTFLPLLTGRIVWLLPIIILIRKSGF